VSAVNGNSEQDVAGMTSGRIVQAARSEPPCLVYQAGGLGFVVPFDGPLLYHKQLIVEEGEGPKSTFDGWTVRPFANDLQARQKARSDWVYLQRRIYPILIGLMCEARFMSGVASL
jgi:hypothetical protein